MAAAAPCWPCVTRRRVNSRSSMRRRMGANERWRMCSGFQRPRHRPSEFGAVRTQSRSLDIYTDVLVLDPRADHKIDAPAKSVDEFDDPMLSEVTLLPCVADALQKLLR